MYRRNAPLHWLQFNTERWQQYEGIYSQCILARFSFICDPHNIDNKTSAQSIVKVSGDKFGIFEISISEAPA